jgi:hypothetical protein
VALTCTPTCLLAAVLSTPLLSLVTNPHFPPSSTPSSPASCAHTQHRAASASNWCPSSSHWRPSSWTLPVRAPTARANFLSQSKIFESVQDGCHQQQPVVPNFRVSPNATSSPCQIFGQVQDATSSRCQMFESVQYHCRKFSSQSKTTSHCSDKNRLASYK